MQTGQIKMKAAILVLFSMIAYSYAQTCSPTCGNSTKCGWTCQESGNEIPNADISSCSGSTPTCSNTTVTSGTCVGECVTDTGGNGNGSSKMELLAPLLVLGILARLCFYP